MIFMEKNNLNRRELFKNVLILYLYKFIKITNYSKSRKLLFTVKIKAMIIKLLNFIFQIRFYLN